MRIFYSAFLLIAVGFFQNCPAQGLEISWKRISGMHLYNFYESRPFLDLTHISLERPFKDKRFSAGVDLIFSNYRPELPDYYRQHLDEERFYDRTAAIGIFGRIYTRPARFRLFLQGAVYGNYLHVHQPIVIRYAYGVYSEIIDYKDFIASGALSLGFSVTAERVSYEPYIQLGFSEVPERKRGDRVIVGSVGNLMHDENWTAIIVPLCLKVKIY